MTMHVPTGKSKLVGILAHPAGHVIAPKFYTPSFRKAGLDWHLVPFDVRPDCLAASVRAFAAMANVVGLNITVPHKPAMFDLCDEVGPAARFEGVVNTVRFDNGRLIGESFDGAGFVRAARAEGVLDRNRRVVLVGTGGAGRAIAYGLAAAGIRELSLLNRNLEAARALARALEEAYPALRVDTDERTEDAGLVINATSLGLHPDDPMPLDPAAVRNDAAVFDIIAARDTEFMAACATRGLKVIGGVPMIEHQIAFQTAFWKGCPA